MQGSSLNERKIGYNPNEIICWSYQGKSFQNRRADIYKFLNDSSALESVLGVGNGLSSDDDQKNIFGKVYDEWFHAGGEA